jgi:hypothetical protein
MPTDDFPSLLMHDLGLLYFRAVEFDCHRSPVKKRKGFQSESKIFLRPLQVGHWVVCLAQSRSNCPVTY